MSAAVAIMEKALAAQAAGADLFVESLIQVPQHGAIVEDLEEEARLLPRRPCDQYLAFLKRWNGLDLDIVRFFGAGRTEPGIRRLHQEQLLSDHPVPGALALGSDPAGFTYLESLQGEVWQLDHDGAEVRRLASCFEEFVCVVLFGPQAGEFLGQEWLGQLQAARLL